MLTVGYLLDVPVVLTVLLIVSSSSSAGSAGGLLSLSGYDIRSQNLRVDSIDSQLDRLDQEIARLGLPYDNFAFTSTFVRIVNLEASKLKPCDKNHVACGGQRRQCVHQLLVCDGVRDCLNGRDEDEVICDDVLTTGTTLRGMVHWHSCLSVVDHYVLVNIMSMVRSPFFRSRSTVTGKVTVEPDIDPIQSYAVTGHFMYATRQLVLSGQRAQDGGAYSQIVCNFNRGDNEHADCSLLLESTGKTCAVIKLNRVF